MGGCVARPVSPVEERANPIHEDLERIRVSVETGLQQLHEILHQGVDGTRVRLCLFDDKRAMSCGSFCTMGDAPGLELTLSGSPARFVLRDDQGRELCVPHGRWASMAASGTELTMVGTPDMCRLRTPDGCHLCLQSDTGLGAVREGTPDLWCLRRV